MKSDPFKIDVALDIRAELGEGAIWDSRGSALLWVDINGHRVARFDPMANGGAGDNHIWDIGTFPGTVVPMRSGDLLVAVNEGVAKLEMASGKLGRAFAPEDFNPRELRFNDGKCDPQGRLVVGTTSLLGERGKSMLYAYEAGKFRTLLKGVSISNGVVWSLDGRQMYYIDTPTREVAVFDYDVTGGGIGERRVAVRVPDAMGFPDGMTIDAEGMLWVCLWEGAAVSRWNPATGELLAKYDVPALHATSCAFGGADLDTLYITTARVDTNADVLAKYPQAGAVFSMKPGVVGVRAVEFAG